MLVLDCLAAADRVTAHLLLLGLSEMGHWRGRSGAMLEYAPFAYSLACTLQVGGRAGGGVVVRQRGRRPAGMACRMRQRAHFLYSWGAWALVGQCALLLCDSSVLCMP